MTHNFTPSKYQQDIYDFVEYGKGHGLIKGVAGCAKTTTLVTSITRIPPNKNIIFVAFNVDIVEELKIKVPKYVNVSTVHSMGLTAVKNTYGYNIIVDNNKIYKLFKSTVKGMKIDLDIKDFNTLLSIVKKVIGFLKNNNLTPDNENIDELMAYHSITMPKPMSNPKTHQIDNTVFYALIKIIFIKSANDTKTIDFDDMIYLPRNLQCPKYDYILVDECLPAKSRIILEDGTEKTISEIVENELSCNVLTFNEESNIQESKKVIGWSKKPIADKNMVKITATETYKICGKKYYSPEEKILYCTDNHRIFTKDGYIEAGKLIEGNKIQYESSIGSPEYFEIVSVEKVNTTEKFVYDIETEDNHNFYAEGFLVHNCQDINPAQLKLILNSVAENGRVITVGDNSQSIYGFRGSDAESIPKLIAELKPTILPLSITYRCPKSHVEYANQFVKSIQAADNAIDGSIFEIEDWELGEHVKEGDLILCRNNAPLLKPCLNLISQGIKATIKGADIGLSLNSLITGFKATDIIDLKSKVNNWETKEVGKAMEKDINPSSIIDKAECVRELISSSYAQNINELTRYISKIFSDERASITFSSIHKAKGLESDNVFILHPHLMPSKWAKKDWEIVQENNIHYVACTRAKINMYFVHKPETD